jgi:hypothetical protein
MARQQTAAERELAELMITALSLAGVSASDIEPEAPRIGKTTWLFADCLAYVRDGCDHWFAWDQSQFFDQW